LSIGGWHWCSPTPKGLDSAKRLAAELRADPAASLLEGLNDMLGAAASGLRAPLAKALTTANSTGSNDLGSPDDDAHREALAGRGMKKRCSPLTLPVAQRSFSGIVGFQTMPVLVAALPPSRRGFPSHPGLRSAGNLNSRYHHRRSTRRWAARRRETRFGAQRDAIKTRRPKV
jgi:hypothetical protein